MASKTDTIVQELLDAGADVDSANREGITALMMATYHGHMDVVLLLLNAGANVNLADGQELTALDRAVTKGHTDIARALHSAGERSGAEQ